ncbi:MAG: hypothetical protein ACFFEA_06705 [Candidatus Thorarchaeota archaeon]
MSDDDQLEHLTQYFFMLTENHLGNQYGKRQGSGMSEEFKARFREIWYENKDMMSDALGRRHGVNSFCSPVHVESELIVAVNSL